MRGQPVDRAWAAEINEVQPGHGRERVGAGPRSGPRQGQRTFVALPL